MAEDGKVYERKAIKKWLKDNERSPLTNEPMGNHLIVATQVKNIIEKMVEGRLRKFYEEVVLLKQPFVFDPDKSVEQALKDAEKDVGAPVTLTGFVRMVLGEGVEKKEEDFAAEVAAVSKS